MKRVVGVFFFYYYYSLGTVAGQGIGVKSNRPKEISASPISFPHRLFLFALSIMSAVYSCLTSNLFLLYRKDSRIVHSRQIPTLSIFSFPLTVESNGSVGNQAVLILTMLPYANRELYLEIACSSGFAYQKPELFGTLFSHPFVLFSFFCTAGR